MAIESWERLMEGWVFVNFLYWRHGSRSIDGSSISMLSTVYRWTVACVRSFHNIGRVGTADAGNVMVVGDDTYQAKPSTAERWNGQDVLPKAKRTHNISAQISESCGVILPQSKPNVLSLIWRNTPFEWFFTNSILCFQSAIWTTSRPYASW